MRLPAISERATRLAGLLSLGTVLLAGAVPLLVLVAMLPYGHPQPSPDAVLTRFAALHVVVPALIAGLLLRAGREAWRRGHRALAIGLSVAPAVAAPILFFWGIE